MSPDIRRDFERVPPEVIRKASGFAASINLTSLDGSDGFRLDGAAADDRSGSSVASRSLM